MDDTQINPESTEETTVTLPDSEEMPEAEAEEVQE
jgi:hypothetical protein